MPPETQTSFIPKAPVRDTTPRHTSSVSVLLMVSVIVFLVSAGAYLGAFVYHRMLYNEINDPCSGTACGLKASLEKARAEVRQDLVEEIKRMEQKISLAKTIVSGHTSLLPVFRQLEKTTVRSVQYESFSFSTEGVSVKGKAKDYDSVAQQSDLYKQEVGISLASYTLSDYAENEKGLVTFSGLLVFNPEMTKYASSSVSSVTSTSATSTTL